MRKGYNTFLVILMILDYEVTSHSCPASQSQWESSPRIQDFDKGSSCQRGDRAGALSTCTL